MLLGCSPQTPHIELYSCFKSIQTAASKAYRQLLVEVRLVYAYILAIYWLGLFVSVHDYSPIIIEVWYSNNRILDN